MIKTGHIWYAIENAGYVSISTETTKCFNHFFLFLAQFQPYFSFMCKPVINLVLEEQPRQREKRSPYLPRQWSPGFQRLQCNFRKHASYAISFTCTKCIVEVQERSCFLCISAAVELMYCTFFQPIRSCEVGASISVENSSMPTI